MANAYDAILNQYRNKTTQTKTKKSGSFDLTRYFSTFLPEGVNSGTKRIRILPSAVEGESPFVTMAIHSMKVDGKYPKMICPEKEDGTDCPLCETRKTLYAANTEATIEAAKKYGSKDMYAIRVIDRDKEEEGPKWFRFWHNYKNEGIFDQIVSLMEAYNTDITDENSGMDLILNIKRDSMNPKVCKVMSILPSDKGPLSENAETAKGWINNGETWRDVYTIKSYDYLKIVALGKTPVWSSEAKGFISKEDEGAEAKVEAISNTEIIMGGSALPNTPAEPILSTPEVSVTPTPEVSVTPTAELGTEGPTVVEDDLPF